jgi:hypothetical protein
MTSTNLVVQMIQHQIDTKRDAGPQDVQRTVIAALDALDASVAMFQSSRTCAYPGGCGHQTLLGEQLCFEHRISLGLMFAPA